MTEWKKKRSRSGGGRWIVDLYHLAKPIYCALLFFPSIATKDRSLHAVGMRERSGKKCSNFHYNFFSQRQYWNGRAGHANNIGTSKNTECCYSSPTTTPKKIDRGKFQSYMWFRCWFPYLNIPQKIKWILFLPMIILALLKRVKCSCQILTVNYSRSILSILSNRKQCLL